MYEKLKAELRRAAERTAGGRFEDLGNDMVKFEGEIDLRFLASCLDDQHWENLTRKLRQL